MASGETTFGVEFRTLLDDILTEIQWAAPIYSKHSLGSTTANLVIRKGQTPSAAFFTGHGGATLAESEEKAAEEAVDYLVQKKLVIIDDVNLERRNKYKACRSFFKNKRAALESTEYPGQGARSGLARCRRIKVPSTLTRVVTTDLWDVWLKVVKVYNITTDPLDFMPQPPGLYVCCFAVTWPDHGGKERFFIGDTCGSLEKAKQSLAKKAIQYFQTIFGFDVKDANFNRMKYALIQCGFDRNNYLLAKERQVCAPSDLNAVPIFVADSYHTPEGPEYGISAGLAMPAAPKRKRSTPQLPVSIEN